MASILNCILPQEICDHIDDFGAIQLAREEHEKWFQSLCLAEMMFVAKLEKYGIDNFTEDGAMVCGNDPEAGIGSYFETLRILRHQLPSHYAVETYYLYEEEIAEYTIFFN